LEAAVGAALTVGAAVPFDPLDLDMLMLPFIAFEAAVGAALTVGAAVPFDPLDMANFRTFAALAEGAIANNDNKATSIIERKLKRAMVKKI
jgi:hypothetical protein